MRPYDYIRPRDQKSQRQRYASATFVKLLKLATAPSSMMAEESLLRLCNPFFLPGAFDSSLEAAGISDESTVRVITLFDRVFSLLGMPNPLLALSLISIQY